MVADANVEKIEWWQEEEGKPVRDKGYALREIKGWQ